MTQPAAPQVSTPTKRLALFVGALIALFALLVIFRDIFWPLLLALGLAYLLDPIVTWLERRRVPRSIGVLVTGLLFVLAVTLVLLFVVPAVGEQLQRLVERLPGYWDSLRQTAIPWLSRVEAEFPAPIKDLPDTIIRTLRENIPQVATQAGKIVTGLFGNLLDMVLLFLGLAFVLVFTFYVLRDFPAIKAAAFDLVPVPYREVTRARLEEVDDVVAGFVRGQLAIALIVALLNSTGLTLLQVPMGLLIGLGAGVGNLIPYMSIVIGLVPALILSWLEQGSLVRLLAILGLFIGVQMLEGAILSPRILGRSVNLHPVWVLLAVIAGGNLFGFFGMLLAVPVAGAIQVFARHWLAAYRTSSLYWGAPRGEGVILPPESGPRQEAAGAAEQDLEAKAPRTGAAEGPVLTERTRERNRP
ncbi:MAG: AI-2E family transporter [Candidatus Methylomirabilales bacterium]